MDGAPELLTLLKLDCPDIRIQLSQPNWPKNVAEHSRTLWVKAFVQKTSWSRVDGRSTCWLKPFLFKLFLPCAGEERSWQFSFASSSAVLWDAEDGVRFQCRRGGCKLSAGYAPSRFSGYEYRRTGSSNRNHVSLERPHSRAVGASRTSMTARGSHKHRRLWSGRRTPTRRQLWHKSEFPSWIAALRAIGDDDTAPSFREALKKKARQQTVPLST